MDRSAASETPEARSASTFCLQILPDKEHPGCLTKKLYGSGAALLQEIWQEALAAPRVANKGDQPCFSPVELTKPYLVNDNVRAVTALVTDHDGVSADFAERHSAQLKARGISHAAYPTPSYGQDTPEDRAEGKTPYRWRFVYALDHPVEIDDPDHWKEVIYPGLVKHVGLTLAKASADPTCADARRLYYMPCRTNEVQRPEPILFIQRPIAVAAILAELPEYTAPAVVVSTRSPLGPASPEVIDAALKELLALPRAVQGEGGHKKAMRAGGLLLHDWALSEREVRDLLPAWNATCKPAFRTDIETGNDSLWARVFGKSFKGEYGAKRLDFATWWHFCGSKAPVANTDAEGTVGTNDDAPAHPHYAEEYERALREIRGYLGTKIETAPDYRPIENLGDVLKRGADEGPPPLIPNLYRANTLNMIVALPKSGKTWDVIDLAIALASGRIALGKFQVPEAVPVYLHLAEDLESGALERVNAFLKDRAFTDEDHRRFLFAARKPLNIRSDESLASLIAHLRLAPIPPKVIILDPLGKIAAGLAINAWEEMQDVARRLEAVRDLLGATVVFSHHAKKPSKENAGQKGGVNAAGSIALYAAAESILYISECRRDGETLIQKIEAEGRYDPLEDFSFQIQVEKDHRGRCSKVTVTTSAMMPFKDPIRAGKERDRVLAVFREAWQKSPNVYLSGRAAIDELQKTKAGGMARPRFNDIVAALVLHGNLEALGDSGKHRYKAGQADWDERNGVKRAPGGVAAPFLAKAD